MKENVSSVEYAKDWYGEDWRQEIPSNLELLDPQFNLIDNPLIFIQTLEKQSNTSIQGLINLISNSGKTLQALIKDEINQLAIKAEEQLASLFLRKKFGPPGDPLVSVVFAELAQREVIAKKTSKNSAAEIARLTKEFEQSIIDKLIILIASLLNKVEEERKQYTQAEKNSQQISNQTPEIAEQMQAYRPKFDKKFEDLKKQENLLTNFYDKLNNYLFSKENLQKNIIVFELATQTTNPTSF